MLYKHTKSSTHLSSHMTFHHNLWKAFAHSLRSVLPCPAGIYRAAGRGVCLHNLYRTIQQQWSETPHKSTVWSVSGCEAGRAQRFVTPLWVTLWCWQDTGRLKNLTTWGRVFSDVTVNHLQNEVKICSNTADISGIKITSGLRLYRYFLALCLLKNAE